MRECEVCREQSPALYYLSAIYPRCCAKCFTSLSHLTTPPASRPTSFEQEFDESEDVVFDFATDNRQRRFIGGIDLMIGMKKQILRRGDEIQKMRKAIAYKDAKIEQLAERLDRAKR